MNDVIIQKRNGGLGRRFPSGDAISGLVANGVAVVGGVQLNTTYRLKSVKDALLLLILPAYDSDNSVLVYEHISEFFRVNPNGDLYLQLVAKSMSYVDMLDITNTNSAKKLLIEADGTIKQLGIAYNPATSVTDFSDTLLAVTKAQELATEEYAQHRPVQIVLEGKGFDLTSTTDLRAMNAKNVSVMIGQAIPVLAQDPTYSAVGTLLGVVSLAKVNENIAWVERFNMYGGRLTATSIGGVNLSAVSEGKKEILNDYGHIFFIKHTGRAGFYLNDSHTCTIITDDYAYVESNRVIDKGARAIRQALLPKLNAPVLVDTDTGRLSPEVVKYYESLSRKALEAMISNGELSGADVFVDPFQDIIATSEFQVEFDLIPTGTNRKIKAILGFSNPF